MQAAGYSFSWLKDTLCDSEAALSKETGERTYSIIDREIMQSPPGSNKILICRICLANVLRAGIRMHAAHSSALV